LFGPDVKIRIDAETVRKIGRDLNLKFIKEIDFGDYFWGIIFKK